MPSYDGPLQTQPEEAARAQEYSDSVQVTGAATSIKSATTPTAAPTLALGAAGVLTGVYKYKVTYVSNRGGESPASAASGTISPAAQQVTVTIPVNAYAGDSTVRRVIYRTKAGGNDYFRVGTVEDNSTTTFTDNVADSALGPKQVDPITTPCQLYSIMIPAAGTVIVYDNLNAASGKILFTVTATGPFQFAPCVPVIARLGLTVNGTCGIYFS